MSVLLEKPKPQTKEPGRSPFRVSFPFTKFAADEGQELKTAGGLDIKAVTGDLLLRGYANTWGVDRDFEAIAPGAFDASMPNFLSKNPILLWQHNPDWPMGQVLNMDTDQFGLKSESYTAKVKPSESGWRHHAFHMIERGIVRTHSVGGFFERDFVEGLLMITVVDLMELSVVSIPANEDSLFEAGRKALLGIEVMDTVLTDKAISQMSQLLGMDPITDPDLLTMTPETRKHRFKELCKLYRNVGAVAPTWDSWNTILNELEKAEKKVDVMPAILHAIKLVRGLVPEEGKAGRVLSKTNQNKLENARDHINEVLKHVQEQEAGEAATSDEEVADEAQEAIYEAAISLNDARKKNGIVLTDSTIRIPGGTAISNGDLIISGQNLRVEGGMIKEDD